ncbi:LysR substrate-binding domain-containing protein [Caballeronia sordidicola]|uniref:Transcriptional regulator, LysR family n=1 Tax=Caballeronia sordidicola TaxID=196367 RepID=A0A242MY38_CABSO|nr:LysR substrate-binding domain-containing protein [Caballeronia sordidicola]OTP76347.1 Transcriptional regulator, LysR family [Caballeronia sordidicola]
MDAADLRIFESVARNGSMNRAALELYTVQSNVTARIRLLEEELGATLFHRHHRGVELTAAGRRLLPFSRQMARLLDDARTAVKDEGVASGPLVLGTLETTAALRMPNVLAQFTVTFPKVELVMRTGTTASLVEDVLQYRLDGAFVAGPVTHEDLHTETIFNEEMALVTARRFRSVRDLAQTGVVKTIVFRQGCSYRARLESVLTRLGLQVSTPLEFGSLDAMLGCVAAGVGVTLLPKGVAMAASREGRVALHELAPDDAFVDTVFVRRHDVYASSAVNAFLAIARPVAMPALASA